MAKEHKYISREEKSIFSDLIIDEVPNEPSEETYDASYALQSGSLSDNDNKERMTSYSSENKEGNRK